MSAAQRGVARCLCLVGLRTTLHHLRGGPVAGDRHVGVPSSVTPDLAEIVGYFMGDGSLHAKGIRLCVADTDLDVAERLGILAKGLFGLEPVVTQQEGYREVVLQSVRLARWWQAAGFAKGLPNENHSGKGWVPVQHADFQVFIDMLQQEAAQRRHR